jgi:hypothetical protein
MAKLDHQLDPADRWQDGRADVVPPRAWRRGYEAERGERVSGPLSVDSDPEELARCHCGASPGQCPRDPAGASAVCKETFDGIAQMSVSNELPEADLEAEPTLQLDRAIDRSASRDAGETGDVCAVQAARP